MQHCTPPGDGDLECPEQSGLAQSRILTEKSIQLRGALAEQENRMLEEAILLHTVLHYTNAPDPETNRLIAI